ncbi:hypothetical protein Tco_0212123 [Tanacetum coccineum]
MLRRNLGDTLRRKGCDDSFLRWSMLRRNPSGMLRRKVPWALHFGAFLLLMLESDDSFEDIDYIEASPLDSELVSLEEVKDDILREKLLNIYLLIAKIKSLNDNPTPDCVLKSPSTFPIPVEDSDSFFKKSDTSLSYSDNSLPEFETFSDHTEKTSSGRPTTKADNFPSREIHFSLRLSAIRA